jgi:predicted RecB family endonuclease
MSDDETKDTRPNDLRSLLRSLVAPVIEQVETRVSSQIDDEVAEKVDELLATRMATIDRAIGDLDRHLLELTARLDRLERRLPDELGPPDGTAMLATTESVDDDEG